MRHCGTQDIETDRLVLRQFHKCDEFSVWKNWASDPEVQSLYSEPVYTTLEEVQVLLEKYINAYENDGYYRWAIINKSSSECIGQIAIFSTSSVNHSGEIEYCIGREFQNTGYATEATIAVISYGFTQVGLHRIQICHKENNTPSKRVIEKCGLKFEGVLRDYFYMNGSYVNRHYYSILSSEFD